MIEIMNNTYKLNQIVCLAHLNSRNNFEVISGRIMNYDNQNIWLDVSYDFVSLDEIVKVKRDKIKYIKVTIDNEWR